MVAKFREFLASSWGWRDGHRGLDPRMGEVEGQGLGGGSQVTSVPQGSHMSQARPVCHPGLF